MCMSGCLITNTDWFTSVYMYTHSRNRVNEANHEERSSLCLVNRKKVQAPPHVSHKYAYWLCCPELDKKKTGISDL